MSGGFFRGTSADQDTRFSNKQAKLLKSRKFAPELENLMDMTKVKMDVMRPWIAKRVTELIGFEDEVLINFIYGLLEGKAVNGKLVQISLTGFMERNTGKFMKELWALLLSAQQNVSGVPQQFLDAKEEETRKKKAETDRIANEVQRKKEKEKQELDEEKTKMGGDVAYSRDKHSELKPNVKHDAGGSSVQPADEKERYKRNGRRRSSRGSESPGSSYHSPSLRLSASPSKSNSRSYSTERRRSRSISRGLPSRSRSISLERQDRSTPRRSVTPQRRHITRHSPSPWHRSSYLKQRSRSRSRCRSPIPARYRIRYRSRSPFHHRSRSPVLRRSRTPIRRSLVRYRSRMPLRRRSSSPIQGRSLSPMRGRSPSFVHHRSPSPVRRRSPSPDHHSSPYPVRRSSLSPVHRRTRSPLRRHSPSPGRQSPSPARRRYWHSPITPRQRSIFPVRRRSSMCDRKRSLTPSSGRSPSLQESSSPSHIRRSSLSPVRTGSLKSARSPIRSPGEKARGHQKYSSARHASQNEKSRLPAENHKGTRSAEHRAIISLRSPQRDMKPRDLSSPNGKSPFESDASRGRSSSEEQRLINPRGSPCQRRGRIVQPESLNGLRKDVEPKTRDNSGTSVENENNSSREIGEHKYRSSGKTTLSPVHHKDSVDNVEIRGPSESTKSRKTQLPNSDRLREQQNLSATSMTTGLSVKSKESYDDGAHANDKKISRPDDVKGGYEIPKLDSLPKSSRKSEQNDQNGSLESPSKEIDEHRGKVKEKRKHKKSERQYTESDDYSSYDSYEERKEAKRRRREEKKVEKGGASSTAGRETPQKGWKACGEAKA